MTASTGKTGRGVKFYVLDASSSPAVYTQIANVTGVNIQGRNAAEIDFTHLGSTGGYREFQQGFKDAGTIQVNFHFDITDVSHNLIADLFDAGSTIAWRVDFTALGWNFFWIGNGFIQNPGDTDINVDGPITGAGTIRITGATDFVASS